MNYYVEFEPSLAGPDRGVSTTMGKNKALNPAEAHRTWNLYDALENAC